MDERYRNYFRRRVEELADPGRTQPGEPHPVADAAVAGAMRHARKAARRADVVLRDDAEVVLIVLARELVGWPVSAASPERSGKLTADLTHDVVVVVEKAAEASEAREISAHLIIDALSDSWSELASARYELWDG